MRFAKPTKAIGLDIGSHSIKAIQMSKSGSKMKIEDIGYALVDRDQVNIDPVVAHADALREAIRTMPISQSLVVGALPGQTVVIRYPRLHAVSPDSLDAAVESEASQNIPYDLSEVFLDWSLLEEEGDDEDRQLKVLLVAAKHEVIDSRVQIADAADIQYGILGVDSLALADAAEGCDFLRAGETVALINIGASSASIHFTRDGVSNFIRDVNWGAREMIQAISKAKRIEYGEAERILYDLDKHLAQAEEGGQEEFEENLDASLDALSESLEPPADNASLLDPLDDELGALSEPEREPDFGDDLSPEAGMGNVEMEADVNLRDVLVAPISRLVSEIRRSFDYYEHQLYERSVDRIILSGGVAHLSLIQDALRDDLGAEEVSLADPGSGAIGTTKKVRKELDRHPSQFMVAVGLAARGIAEL